MIADLRVRGYLDDARFAETLVSGRSSRRGRAAIRGELMAKGIDRETAGEALAALDPDTERAAALNAAVRMAGSRSLPDDRQERRRELSRLAGRLARRGFGTAAVRAAVAAVDQGLEVY